MPDSTSTALLAFLQKHGFLTRRQVQELGRINGTMFADTRLLIRELVGRDWLTAYQANQLLQERGRELLLGPYRLLDRLGEGGMGQVFKAHHNNMDRVVALKIIPKDRVSDPVAVSRFYREVRAVAKLSHPTIVTAFEVNQAGETHYLAMEFVDGIDLARLVQQSGPLAILQACDYIRQAAVGLQHAHEKGLVHRDIKPGNLMVTRPCPDEPPLIKILDFGLARFESESDRSVRLTQLGNIVGTVDYIAPEQAQNPRTADIRADIYSLGCSLFYLLTGNPPFSGDDAVEKIAARVDGDVPPVRKSRPEVSPILERILVKMTARNPANRYQTPGEVAKTLQLYIVKNKQARIRPTTVTETQVVPKVACQAAWPVTTETLADQATIRPRGDNQSAKGRGILMGVLIAAGVFGFSCLGLGTLFFMASGGTPTTSNLEAKGKTGWEMERGEGDRETAKNVSPEKRSNPNSQIAAKTTREPKPGMEPKPRVQPEPVVAGPRPEERSRKRVAAPDEIQLAEARNQIRAKYRDDYKDKRKLAKWLYQSMPAGPPAMRYAMLTEARELATQSGDFATALITIRMLCEEFDDDSLEMKYHTVKQVLPFIASKHDYHLLTQRILLLVDRAMIDNRYDLADRLLNVARDAAEKADTTIVLKKAADHLAERLATERTETARVKSAAAKLDMNPEDEEASLAIGKFRCVTREDWEGGLPLLERGSDVALRELARKDLANPSDALNRVKLGDAWYDRANQSNGKEQSAYRKRAFCWYQDAIAELDRKAQDRVKRRLKLLMSQLPELADPFADLDYSGPTVNPKTGLLHLGPHQVVSTRRLFRGSLDIRITAVLPKGHIRITYLSGGALTLDQRGNHINASRSWPFASDPEEQGPPSSGASMPLALSGLPEIHLQECTNGNFTVWVNDQLVIGGGNVGPGKLKSPPSRVRVWSDEGAIEIKSIVVKTCSLKE
jgi:serine/threonine-protein kinase